MKTFAVIFAMFAILGLTWAYQVDDDVGEELTGSGRELEALPNACLFRVDDCVTCVPNNGRFCQNCRKGYFNKNGKRCIKCATPGCQVCQPPNGKVCTQCFNGNNPQNNSCFGGRGLKSAMDEGVQTMEEDE